MVKNPLLAHRNISTYSWTGPERNTVRLHMIGDGNDVYLFSDLSEEAAVILFTITLLPELRRDRQSANEKNSEL